jgi:hypothetical protein
MIVRKMTMFVGLLVCILSAAISVMACACCVDPGYYQISTGRPTDYELATLEEIKFDGVANLYESEAGFDGIKGLDVFRKFEETATPLDLNVVEKFLNKAWTFTLKSGANEGTLFLPMPQTMVRFKVDLHDNEPGTETGLYKELRFKGVVRSGTGLFRMDVVKPTSYFLVFQGRGNGCDSSADYTHWRLELSGPKAGYALFGKLLP